MRMKKQSLSPFLERMGSTLLGLSYSMGQLNRATKTSWSQIGRSSMTAYNVIQRRCRLWLRPYWWKERFSIWGILARFSKNIQKSRRDCGASNSNDISDKLKQHRKVSLLQTFLSESITRVLKIGDRTMINADFNTWFEVRSVNKIPAIFPAQRNSIDRSVLWSRRFWCGELASSKLAPHRFSIDFWYSETDLVSIHVFQSEKYEEAYLHNQIFYGWPFNYSHFKQEKFGFQI